MARTVASKSPTRSLKPTTHTASLRRSLRSSSRKRESSSSEHEDHDEEQQEEEVQASHRKLITPARSTSKSRKPIVPNEKKSVANSVANSVAKSASLKRPPHSSSRQRTNNDDTEVEQPASRKSPVRIAKKAKKAKQIQAKPTNSDSDEDSETALQAPPPRHTLDQQPSSSMNQNFSDFQAKTGMYRPKQALVFVDLTDAIYLLVIFIFPFMMGLFNIMNLFPVIRQAMIAQYPILIIWDDVPLTFAQLFAINMLVLVFTIIAIAFKLALSQTAEHVTQRITSMIFRGYVALTLLFTWTIVSRYQILPFDTLRVLALTLFPFAVFEAAFAFRIQTFARWVEQVFICGVTSFTIFEFPIVYPVEQSVVQAIIPSIVVYLVLNVILSIGYVGMLSSSNKTYFSLLVTSVSHAFIWIHLLLTIGGPLFILYFEMLKDLTVLNDRTQVIAKASGIAISVILHFANYADSIAIENLQIRTSK